LLGFLVLNKRTPPPTTPNPTPRRLWQPNNGNGNNKQQEQRQRRRRTQTDKRINPCFILIVSNMSERKTRAGG
jgi:hypothetical protein